MGIIGFFELVVMVEVEGNFSLIIRFKGCGEGIFCWRGNKENFFLIELCVGFEGKFKCFDKFVVKGIVILGRYKCVGIWFKVICYGEEEIEFWVCILIWYLYGD